ncbi:hypothetical protein TNCV_986521 [Trichonephila clavipes]|uniref:Uncharacterized protein n=1 Tax=Trichonephila clavipes TaxID=2585209 RepID=A0A8X6VNX9_TRICX|nr:hypothetical protein TNCV_986521 [Trichonephila clavipes]
MVSVDFLHHEKSPTWADVEFATIGVQGHFEGPRYPNEHGKKLLADAAQVAHFYLDASDNPPNGRLMECFSHCGVSP